MTPKQLMDTFAGFREYKRHVEKLKALMDPDQTFAINASVSSVGSIDVPHPEKLRKLIVEYYMDEATRMEEELKALGVTDLDSDW